MTYYRWRRSAWRRCRYWSCSVLRAASQEDAERFFNVPDHLDALEISFDCYVRLLRIAELLAQETGLPSRHRTITDDDILEGTFADADGNITRVKRDGTTGRLVEYKAS